ncbi:MAG: SMI1/KNR4 family protein [Pirellulales bacterium]
MTPDWLQIIESHHAKAHPNDGYNLVTRPPASRSQLDELGDALGIQFPVDFRSLYLTCNGVGVVHKDDPDKIWWLFRPAEEIEGFAADVRNWFRKTHNKYADRFFPFIDFSNGDGIGYVVDESGIIIDGLFCFEHEKYRFKADQDVNDFLSHAPVTIEEFLTCM